MGEAVRRSRFRESRLKKIGTNLRLDLKSVPIFRQPLEVIRCRRHISPMRRAVAVADERFDRHLARQLA